MIIQHNVSVIVKGLSAIALASILGAPAARAAITLKFFPASDYSTDTSAMNKTLGVRGYTLDDFSEVALLPGLTITLTGGEATSPITYTTLPAIYNQNTLASDCYNFGNIPNLGIASWTGATAVTNIIGNSFTDCNTQQAIGGTVTFDYSPGATSLGIGFANFQSADSPVFPITNHELFVNGVDLGVLETLAGENWAPGIVLNGYLRISATGNSVITSVAVTNSNGAYDFLGFSDLAIKQRIVTSALLGVSPTSAVKGAVITLSATVADESGSVAPTGTVTFNNGAAVVGTATLDSSGIATLETAKLPAGSDSVTASYHGNSKSAPSTSAAVIVSIKIDVPNVVGLTRASAKTAIVKSGLTLGTVTRAPSTTIPAGSVSSESPAAGTTVAVDAAVDLVISSGAH